MKTGFQELDVRSRSKKSMLATPMPPLRAFRVDCDALHIDRRIAAYKLLDARACLALLRKHSEMHRYFASTHEQARATIKTVAALGFVALAFGGVFWPERCTPPVVAIVDAIAGAAQAADAPRAERSREPKAAARNRSSRTPRDAPSGREGDPRKATRNIRIEMSDAMRYFPDHVRVKKGQTVRFSVRNAGEDPHEMVIGTMDDLKKAAAQVRRDPDEPLDEPNATRVDAGQTGRIVWQFTRAGEFYFGCLIPGHFEAGMIGTIVVR
jgi:uncharacterized cupredoxin-like copper-binding protein